jgi:glycosyltransferase involved in cell wall biosynthesis
MRIILAHNYYQQPGGEDQVFAAESSLLKEKGHEVWEHTVHNESLSGLGGARLATLTVWNRESYSQVRALIRRTKPDLIHFHNTFPLISPAAYRAAKHEGIPVVQTLHNYRLVCPSAILFRDGHLCEECLGRRFAWPGIVHACYRGSRSATAVVALMLGVHRWLHTWARDVDVFIALTEFARQKFISGGLPAQKLLVKPNFLSPDPGPGRGNGGYALFVGRLVPEKGVRTLLRAWEQSRGVLPLKIVGTGPLDPEVARAAAGQSGVERLGTLARPDVIRLMQNASMLVFPSLWYEGLSMTIVEALAVGLPVVASDLENLGSLVVEGVTGLRFRTGDPDDLIRSVQRAAGDPRALALMRQGARAHFEAQFTGGRNYELLMACYAAARGR